ncbi:MAG: hypothetical protein Ct9H300mP27_11810 [Chloroflexota bacterium]|nr:MAG: hypothetical protein Ct9H300mP27_11810 [Chloroflexota bacterium]
MPRPRTRARDRRAVPQGKAYIYSTFNNTIISITTHRAMLFLLPVRGPLVLKVLAKEQRLLPRGQQNRQPVEAWIWVFVKLMSYKRARSGREAAIRSLQGAGLL